MSAIESVREDIRKTWGELPEGPTCGIIFSVRKKKQFGFLIERMSLKMLFFHASQAAYFFQLEPGDLVTFRVEEDEKNGGVMAANVERYNEGSNEDD